MTDRRRPRPIDYFRVTPIGSADEIGAALWSDITAADYDDEPHLAYQAAVLAQYEIYVEMADRVSARRATANAFFVTLNTSVFVLLASLWESERSLSVALLSIAAIALISECFVWFWTLRSYRQLNTAKYAVIGALERQLPAQPYSDAEWIALGEGRDPSRYWPLTHVETAIPLLFALGYIAAFATIIAT